MEDGSQGAGTFDNRESAGTGAGKGGAVFTFAPPAAGSTAAHFASLPKLPLPGPETAGHARPAMCESPTQGEEGAGNTATAAAPIREAFGSVFFVSDAQRSAQPQPQQQQLPYQPAPLFPAFSNVGEGVEEDPLGGLDGGGSIVDDFFQDNGFQQEDLEERSSKAARLS